MIKLNVTAITTCDGENCKAMVATIVDIIAGQLLKLSDESAGMKGWLTIGDKHYCPECRYKYEEKANA